MERLKRFGNWCLEKLFEHMEAMGKLEAEMYADAESRRATWHYWRPPFPW